MIRCEAVTYQLRSGRELVSKIDLHVPAGEVLAIVGPNGAGKSTLIKLIVGQMLPTSGRVLFDNIPLPEFDLAKLARRRAVLPQHSAIPFEFTAAEIVLLGRSPHVGSSSRQTDDAIVQAAMAATDTTHLAERSVVTLSGGELQRVQLARVLAQIWDEAPEGPRILLMDEPTSALDPAHQHATLRIARTWAEKGSSVAVILHDLNLAAYYADRILILHEGRCTACDTPAKVLTPEMIKQVFGIAALVQVHPTRDCPLVLWTP